jgi:hypothetical protein
MKEITNADGFLVACPTKIKNKWGFRYYFYKKGYFRKFGHSFGVKIYETNEYDEHSIQSSCILGNTHSYY